MRSARARSAVGARCAHRTNLGREDAISRIPFNKASLLGNELRYVSEAIAGGWISGDGPFSKRCEEHLRAELGAARVLLTTSCTHALEMAAILLDVGPGDEVLLPSFAFTSCANAFVLRGAKPVFVDVRPDTLNLDERLIAAALTPRTKAILPIHYAGVGCEMDAISAVASAHRIAVVEDNAHGLFGRYRGRYLGTLGALGTQSFHETKNFTCGEGGALVINDPRLVERAEILREKGTNRSRFFRGLVDKYTWVDLGSSYVPSDMLAAFLLGQLERRAEIEEARRKSYETYRTGLRGWAERNGVALPQIPAHVDSTFHLFHVLLPTGEARDALAAHLRARDVLAVFHYLPLHLSDMGIRLGGRVGDCPVTEDASARLLRLPMYASLGAAEQSRVIEAVTEFSPS